jgi:hypothetical protein
MTNGLPPHTVSSRSTGPNEFSRQALSFHPSQSCSIIRPPQFGGDGVDRYQSAIFRRSPSNALLCCRTHELGPFAPVSRWTLLKSTSRPRPASEGPHPSRSELQGLVKSSDCLLPQPIARDAQCGPTIARVGFDRYCLVLLLPAPGCEVANRGNC